MLTLQETRLLAVQTVVASVPTIKQPTKRQHLLLAVVCLGNKRAEVLSKRYFKPVYPPAKLRPMTQSFLDFMQPEHNLKHRLLSLLNLVPCHKKDIFKSK